MTTIPLPPYPTGTVAAQVARQYSYLFQMAQQLNMALQALDGALGTAVENKPGAGAAAQQTAQDSAVAINRQYQNLRAMILKTAEEVEKTTQQLSAELKEKYVAQSEFGTYVQNLSAYLEANPEALTQYYGFCSDLKTNIAAVDAAFSHYRVNTEGFIRTGIVYYDGSVPVYGVAVGQNLTSREVDGEQLVEMHDFRAVFTAEKLSFWQDDNEVAYVSNNRLYITHITVLDTLNLGKWRMECRDGLAFKWMGGTV